MSNRSVFGRELIRLQEKLGARAWDIEHTVCNSFAFGGSNGVHILSRYRGANPRYG